MTDLERFFRALVAAIAERDPLALHQPIRVAELVATHFPYRSARRTLGIDTHEDYELLVVRLAAGERGLVTTTPPEAQREFAAEAASSNPDLAVLRRHEAAELVLAGEPLAYALGPSPEERAYAPPPSAATAAAPAVVPLEAPEAPEAHEALGEAAAVRPSDAAAEALDEDALLLDAIRIAPEIFRPARTSAPAGRPSGQQPPPPAAPLPAERCGYCGGTLPSGRVVNFCPHCGQNQTTARCPECHGEVEVGWRHCVTCGSPLG